MKKFLCIALALMMVLGMCACGGNGEGGASGDSEDLQVGFGRVNITPDYTVQLAGGSTTRLSTGYMDYSYVTCVAIKPDDQTYLVFTMDFICAEDVFVDPAKAAIAEATGIPEANILMNATHTHSGVAIRTDTAENVAKYRGDFYVWATEAAQAAVADLSAAEVYRGSTETGMAYVRHYVNAEGGYYGPNFGDSSPGLVSHTSEADTELQLIRFTRAAEDKKDVVMINFPAHATLNQSSTSLSADFPGPTRDYIEQNSDSLVAYFIAAAGNQVPSGRLSGESPYSDYVAYGQALGQCALDIMDSLTKVEGQSVKLSTETFVGQSMKEGLDRLAEAQAVKAQWDVVGRGTDAGKAAAQNAGFSSVYEVSAILERAGTADTNEMEIKVMSIGDMGLIFAPYEMFSEQGMYIKEKSPYDFTFIVTCGEGAEGYLPSELGCEIGSYEYMVTDYARGTAEQLADEFVKMLTEIKNPAQ